MKTIEEKAKSYDEALSVAQETYATQPMYREWLAKMFPELIESEDEKIRKELLDYCKTKAEKYRNDPKYKNIGAWIAWLEKQGEKGTNGNNEEIPNSEQKPAEWSDDDVSMLYCVMETEQYMLDVVNGIKKFDVGNNDIRKACAEELNWLKDLQEKVQPQPKQEWREEDRKLIDETCNLINTLASGYGEKVTEPISFAGVQQINRIKTRLRALVDSRPQNTWRPTKEQIEALEKHLTFLQRINAFGENADRLKDLYNDLKKLREE